MVTCLSVRDCMSVGGVRATWICCDVEARTVSHDVGRSQVLFVGLCRFRDLSGAAHLPVPPW